ncbi:hypothetical protein BMETH_1891_0 [methanotrophic bacterial endosymbiont of Bathymodiolus sp.]|nr:hypothetical protein BMETH_1891_0 [methanotrophic bacterial endosymbiont of Bathymodiolus sp.]
MEKIINMVRAVKKEPVKIVQVKLVTAIDSPKPFIKWVGKSESSQKSPRLATEPFCLSSLLSCRS